ncbi:autotransporter outer membrane beta-barrel domain-containing protein [Escherichia coli]|uniref:autotransporter outer membrane beta-barrel domain-containing protein n=1 Tax=Escherichia TaxID=561 RepID=UPI001E5BEA8C|nr:autotransporter outer membrane beta-barrel domain-containing protein [Escherichia coli]UHR04295.1 autotransporter outer membrane beta-barrel domain-containing protein [Escherichia coli]
MNIRQHPLSTLAIAISTVLSIPISQAWTPPATINSDVTINNNDVVTLSSSENNSPVWDQFRYLNVGATSAGTLNIDGRDLTTAKIVIGNATSGTIKLENNTHLTLSHASPNERDIYLGTNGGSGTLMVLSGSTITDLNEFRIGEFNYQAQGQVVIDGEGSSVAARYVMVGDQGTGKLEITHGGHLTASKDMIIGFNGNMENFQGTGYGETLVDGDNSSLAVNEFISLGGLGSLLNEAKGILTVSNNATVSANQFIWLGMDETSTGILNIGGAQGEAEQKAGAIKTPIIHMGSEVGDSTAQINFNHSSEDFILAADIVGKGEVNQVGSGVTTLAGANTYSGQTNISKGTLRAGINDTFSPNSSYVVSSGGNIDLAGFSQTLNALDLAGTATLSSSKNGDKFTPATLTINGNYSANNGLLVMRTALGDDNSATDKLIVKGNTSGHTRVSVHNAGGQGADTLEGIRIVEITGASEGTFSKEGRIVAGAYDYNVTKSDDQNWYLTSETPLIPPVDPVIPDSPEPPDTPTPASPYTPVSPEPLPERKHQYRPEISSYLANIQAANTLFNTRLHDRLGETQYTDLLTGEQKVTSLWLRNIGGHNRFKDRSDELSTQSNRYVLQLGGDLAQWSSNALDRWHLGLMAGYANSKSHTHSSLTGYNSRGQIDGYSVGVYGTWYANEADKTGTYVDSWLLYNWFDNTVSGEYLPSEKYHSDGITAAIEAGYTFRLGESADARTSYWLQPKMQLTWMDVKADNHTEDNGTLVEDSTEGNLQTRLGVKAYLQGHNAIDDHKARSFQPFVEANWIYNSRNYSVKMDGISDEIIGTRNIGELKVGVEGQLNPRLQLWGNVAQQLGDNGYSDTQGMLGMKYLF